MMRYPLTRAEKPLMWLRLDDAEQGVIYFYVRFLDRVDVFKIPMGSSIENYLDSAAGVEDLIRVSQPRYRVAAGQCTCDGYHFRETCRHVKIVKTMRVEISAS